MEKLSSIITMRYSTKSKMPMNTHRRITANFLSLLFSEFASKIIQLLVFVYLARTLGKGDFGIFSFGLAFGLLAAILADFGLNSLLTRDISRNRKNAGKYLSNAVLVKIFLGLATVLLAYIVLELMGYDRESKLVAYIMLAFAILQTFTEIYSSIFRAFERMHYDGFIKVLRMVILSTMAFYSLKSNVSLIAASVLFPITELMVLMAVIWLAYAKFVKISFGFDFDFSKNLLRESSFFCLSIALAGLFLYIDWIMISKFSSSSEVGIYAAASNIALALLAIPMMYGNAVYPVISRLYLSSKGDLRFLYERSFKYMLLIGIAVSAGIYATSNKIIGIFYGKEYLASSIVLSIIGWHLCLRFANIMSGFTLSAMDRQRSRVLSQGVAVASKIALNFILIPIYGIIGAAFATLIAEVIFFISYNFFVAKYGIKINVIKPFIKPAIAALIMIIAIYFVENFLIAVIVGIFAYAVSLFALRTIDREDKRIIGKVVRNV